MVLLFSKKFGKISAGTNISEKGKSKSSLAMRPFTYGRYELFKTRDTYNINSSEVIRSYYKIGEDVEKYMYCSYILEFTEKLLQEESPAPEIFHMILDFFDIMEKRTKKYSSLTLAYQIKVLQEVGSMPQVRRCVACGDKDEPVLFSVKDGGILCKRCCLNFHDNKNDTLIYTVNFGIVNILRYILDNPLKSFENLALDDEVQKRLGIIIKSYIAYHLDIGELKSESFLNV
jgi:DNA repair protein RecO (recombination protein O)